MGTPIRGPKRFLKVKIPVVNPVDEEEEDDYEDDSNDESNDEEEVEDIQDDFEPETDTILKHISPAAKRFTAMAPPDFSPIERQSRSAPMNISNRSFKSPRATSKSPLNGSNYPNRSLKKIITNSPRTSNRSMNNSPSRIPMVKLATLNNSRLLNNTKSPEITRRSPIIRQ